MRPNMATVIPEEGVEKVLVGDVLVPARFTLVFDRPNNGPRVIFNFAVVKGVPICASVEFYGRSDRGVISTDLRGLKVEDLLEAAVQSAVAWSDTDPLPDYVTNDNATIDRYIAERNVMYRGLVRDTRIARRNARRRIGPDFLAEVARVYRENLDGNPTVAVADFTGRAHRTAALYVKQAREAGLLGVTSPGKKGEQ